MEDLELDPLTWEHEVVYVPNPETRIDWALAEADYATRMVNQHSAGRMVAIHSVLDEARLTPSVFVGPHGNPENRVDVEFALRAAVSDIAVRMCLSESTVLNLEHQAVILMSRTPLVWSAFRTGEVNPASAKVVAELAASLPDASPALYEQFDTVMADLAVRLTPARFRSRARAMREKLLGESADQRAVAEKAFRRVIFEPALDGMMHIDLYTTAEIGVLVQAQVDEQALKLHRDPAETRTLDQLRADVIGEMLLGGDSDSADGSSSVGVRVGLLIPVLSLLGHDTQPAILEGYGPIDMATARRLTKKAKSFYRVLTDPVTGTVLDIDRTTLRIPADMRRWLQMRDQTCVFSGCGRKAKFCELDHIRDRQYGGITKVANLEHLCKKHHREKHHTLWKPQHMPDGSIQWTSPTGHVVRSDAPPF